MAWMGSRGGPQDPQEKYIEGKVCAYAKKLGWLVRKLQWIGFNGAPDRLFMKAGRMIFIEFKQLGKKPSANQKIEIERLRDAGMEVYVIDNIAAGMAVFDRSTNYRPNDDLI